MDYNAEDCTIILQGLTHPDIDIIIIIERYLKVCPNLILSIYKKTEDPLLIERINRLFPNVLIINNDLTEYENELKFLECDRGSWRDVTYFHLNTTQKALNLVKTKYVLKSRVDHYYINIKDMIILCKNTGKIVCSSLFTEGVYHKFFLSDCLYVGLTSEIQNVVKLALISYCKGDYDENHGEVLLWRPYILYKMQLENVDYKDDKAYLDFMEKLFEIWAVNFNWYYRIKFRGRISERMDFLSIRTTREFLQHGGEIELIFNTRQL
jgi:hypothetical protein